MSKLKLEAPWYTWNKKVKALFEADPDIAVSDVYESDNSRFDFIFDIEVYDHEKFVALDRVMPTSKEFGSVNLGIYLFDVENANGVESIVDVYRTIFDGNPIVKDIKTCIDRTGTKRAYVRFVPKVVQFSDDNIADYNGNWSGLAQDIAKEVFQDGFGLIHFCTADNKENEINV